MPSELGSKQCASFEFRESCGLRGMAKVAVAKRGLGEVRFEGEIRSC